MLPQDRECFPAMIIPLLISIRFGFTLGVHYPIRALTPSAKEPKIIDTRIPKSDAF